MKSTSSVLGSQASETLLDSIRDEQSSARYLLGVPLSNPAAFQAAAERKKLPRSVLERLIGMVRGGTGDLKVLLKREDLNADDLTLLAKAPGVGAQEAELIVKHRSCGTGALAELAMVETRRSQERTRRGLPAHTAVYGQVLGVLRTTNTLTRLAAIIFDEDVASNASEIEKIMNAVLELGGNGVETFLTLVKEWHGSVDDLIVACRELS